MADTSDLTHLFGLYPHLSSPASLAHADRGGRYQLPPHLAALNRELWDVGCGDTTRLIVNMPFQHGKSTLASCYFPAWHLLLFPDTPVILASQEQTLAANFGSQVRQVIDRWGPPLGVRLRQDTRAKAEWRVHGHDGGMLCRGMKGGITGRPAGLFLIDDPIKNAEQALSPKVLDNQWDFYKTVVYGRLRAHSRVAIIMTRWCKGDICGRALDMAKRTGEAWRVVRFPALALDGDILGRAKGEPLWPQTVTLSQLEVARKEFGRWWSAAWQQDPEDEEGAFFRPRLWPTYTDIGDAWSLAVPGAVREVHRKEWCTVMVSVDWAWSEKETADYTAILVWALTHTGKLLLLDVTNERIRLEALAPTLAGVCRQWRPTVVGVETGHPTLSREVLQYREIPPVRWLKPQGRTKVQRALPAVMMAEGTPGKIYLPPVATWKEEYVKQLGGFTGLDEGHDDMVDATSWGCQLVQQVQGVRAAGAGMPDVFVAGKEAF